MWGYDDASVRLFDTSSFKEIRRFNNPAGAHVKPPYSWGWAHSMGVQFSPDGKLLAIVRSTGPIELWEVESGKKRHTLSFDRSRRTSFLAFSPDGTRLASGGGDNWGGDHTIRVWDVATGKELNARAGHGAPVSAVAVSPDGETVATAGRDGIVHLWERSSGKHLLRLAGDRCRRPHVAFARDGRRVFAWGDWDPAILRAWDPRSGAIVSKLELRGPDAMWETVSDDGKTALSFNMKGNSLRFHDLATGKVSREIAEAYRAVTLSPSGDHIVWLDGKLTKATDRKELMHVGNPDHPNPGAQFTPDGRRLMMAVISQAMLYSGANDPPAEEIVIIDPIERKVLRRFGKAPDHYFPIHAAAISNDGKMVATVGSEWQKPSEQIITLWETETGRERGRFVGHIGQANGVAITPDGRFVVTGADDTTALVWDASRSPSRGLIRQPTSDLAASFRDLAGDDARQASAAMWAMIDTPRETLAFLAKESSLFAVTDVQKIRRWIGNLDSETFAERDRAFQELGMILDESESHLKKALQARPSAEAHRRVNLLLQARSAGFSGRELQRSRVIELLEHIATPDATALLKRFAARPAEARVTEEAKASLARLRR